MLGRSLQVRRHRDRALLPGRVLETARLLTGYAGADSSLVGGEEEVTNKLINNPFPALWKKYALP